MDFHVGPWLVQPQLGCVIRDQRVCHVSPKSMDVLVCLANRGGDVVSRSDIFQAVWPDTFVSDDSLVRCIAELRRAFDDSGQSATTIQTIPKRGYRLLPTILWNDSSVGGAVLPGQREVTADNKQVRALEIEPRRPRYLAALVLTIVIASAAYVIRVCNRARTSAGTPVIQSIAVLPLTNLSGDPGQEYFADGMTDQLISQLAQIRTLRVISRTSMMRYKGARKSIREIARDLSVNAILEGTVMRQAGRVRITVQVIDAATDQHIWSRSFERNMEDVLSLQSSIARVVAADLDVVVSPREEARLNRVRKVAPDAYELYLKGWYFFNRDQYTRASVYFEEATVRDPGFAMAQALLAEADSMDSFVRDEPISPRAWNALERARRLDDFLAEVHSGLGDVQLVRHWNWTAAEAEYRRAVELDPGSVDAAQHYALFLHAIKRWPAAVEECKRAIHLDPVSPRTHRQLLNLYVDAGRYDVASAEFQRVIELDPDNAAAWAKIALMYEITGREAQAIDAYLKADTLRTGPEAVQALAAAARTAGLRGYWTVRLQQLEQQSKNAPVSPVQRAAIYVRLGRQGDAIEMLEKALSEGRPRLMWVPAGAAWERIRSAPRYESLLRRMHYPGS